VPEGIRRAVGARRDPFTGIGKREPLKGDLSGYWSRRIDDEHRLAYQADLSRNFCQDSCS